jgi:hypothetical protein
MFKNHLRNRQMNSAVFVDQARSHLKELVRVESRGWGDAENAMRRIAKREELSFSALWALTYKPPKSVCASVFYKLTLAREAMRVQQLERYRSDRDSTEGTNWVSQAFLRAADAAIGPDDRGEADGEG